MDEDKKKGEYKIVEMGSRNASGTNGNTNKANGDANENVDKTAGSTSGNGSVTRGEGREGASGAKMGSDGARSEKAYGGAENGPKTENKKKTENLNGWDKNYQPKKKKVPLWAVLVGIVVIIGAVIGVIALISGREGQGEAEKRPETGQEQPDGGDGDDGKDEEIEKPTEAELEAEKERNVRAIVAKMKSALQEYLVTDDGEKLMSFQDLNQVNVFYQAPNMEVAIPLAKSIGFEANSTEAVRADEELWRTLWDKIGGANEAVGSTAVVEKVFTENGFAKTGEEWVPMGEYINYQTGVVCTNAISGMPINFGCGHISWMNKEKVALANELAVAYREGTGRLLGYILAEANNIKDSEVVPYQRLMAQMPGAAVLFYRVSPEAKWQYFAGLQSPLQCEEYKTEDEKKAFAGEVCYNGNEESTVEP